MIHDTPSVDGYPAHILTNLVLRAQTNTVQAALGSYVGFRYQLHVTNGPPPEILICVIRPPRPILDPAAPEPMNPVLRLIDYPLNSHLGFFFEKDWECIPGEWLFQIRAGDALLAEKKLIIVFDTMANSNKALKPAN